MHTPRLALACTALLAALAGPALAQAPAQGSSTAPAARTGHEHHRDHQAHGMQGGEGRPQRFEQRLADLKSQLQLTPAQEGAWTQFVQALRPAAPPQRPDPEAMMKLATPERLDQMRAMRQQHLAQMDRRADATKAFYATLSPDQKQRFDASARRMMEHRRGPAGHGHHGHHG